MAASIDMFCAADDEHRVVLLVELLQRAGQAVVLRPGPVADPTNPLLLACTRRSLAEPWVTALFAGPRDVVAVRLDTTPLPQPCARVIDMQNWPARSADRKVAALVRWLVQHGGAGVAAGGAEVSAGDRSAAHGPGSETAAPLHRRPRQRTSDGLRALLVIGVLVLVGGLLWLSAPEPGERGDGVEPRDPARELAVPGAAGAATAEPSGGAALATQGGGGAEGDAAAGASDGGRARDTGDAGAAGGVGGAGDAAAGTPDLALSVPGSVGPAAGADVSTDAGVTPAPASAVAEAAALAEAGAADAAQAAAAGPPDAADPLAHLCNARSLEAARAWAGTLNWRQRRRLPEEPCVTQLLARPGFEALRTLL